MTNGSPKCDVCNKNIKKSLKTWLCLNCLKEALPFNSEDDNSLYFTNKGIINEQNLHNVDITLSPEDRRIIKEINMLISQNDDIDNSNENFCKYYSIEKFCKTRFTTARLSIFHLNIASIQFHFDELNILLNSLKFKFDIINITETKLQKGVAPIKDINIPNYRYFHTPTEASKGGTLIYVSNDFNAKPRKDLEIYEPKTIESTFVELVLPKVKNIIVGCIYKHHNISINDFKKQLLPIIHKVEKENKPLYLCGDFNIDLLKIDCDKQTNEYFEALTDTKLLPLITIPTRIVAKSKTLIDNVFTTRYNPLIVSGNLTVSISDHVPQFAIIPCQNRITLPKDHNIIVQDFKKLNFNRFSHDLLSLNFDYIDKTENTIHDITTKFVGDVNSVINKHAPLRKITKKEYKEKCKPWLNTTIRAAIQKRDKLFSELKNKDSVEIRNSLKEQVKLEKNKIKQMIRASKKAYYGNMFQVNSGNTKKLWKGINSLIGKGNSKDAINCIEIKENGKLECITDKRQISDNFNTFFCGIAEKILNSRKFCGNKHYTRYLKRFDQSFKINLTDKNEVETIIKNMNPSKSVGPNSIQPGILAKVSEILAEPISKICNISFSTGVFPDPLKISKVIPIHKKESKLEVGNYRPISLLSNINKIIEKLMHFRMQVYLEKHKMIYNLQFGFREKHSTNHAIIGMIEKIQQAMKNKQLAVGIFIDLQKAFDTVNHDILLDKLNHYGIKGISNRWFRSYLSQRKQFTSIDGVNSSCKTVLHGVPQGSVLGPLLFLLYINDLHNCIKNSTVFHFADDTNLMYVPEKKVRNRNVVRRLNVDLKLLNNWLLANKISLNSTKTELVYFRKKGTPTPDHKVTLNGFKLIPSSSIKYVGVLLDEHLTYTSHVNELKIKLKRANNMLSVTRHYVSKNILKQIYYGQFNSRMVYGCLIWGHRNQNINQIFTLQKKALRIMEFAGYSAPSSTLFQDLKVLKFPDIIKLNNILFVHSVLNDKSPEYFRNYFEQIKANKRYEITRNPKSLCSIPSGSIDLSFCDTGSFKYQCALDWNEITKKLSDKSSPPNWLKDLAPSNIKKLVKEHFLSSY